MVKVKSDNGVGSIELNGCAADLFADFGVCLEQFVHTMANKIDASPLEVFDLIFETERPYYEEEEE